MVACNDYILLECCIYRVLRSQFKGHPAYAQLLDLFHEVRAPTSPHTRSAQGAAPARCSMQHSAGRAARGQATADALDAQLHARHACTTLLQDALMGEQHSLQENCGVCAVFASAACVWPRP